MPRPPPANAQREGEGGRGGEGARTPRVSGVPPEASSLSEIDCFILEIPVRNTETKCESQLVVQWSGRSAPARTKLKAIDVAKSIQSDQRVATKIGQLDAVELVVVKQGAEPELFWDALGGRAAVPAANARYAHEAPQSGFARRRLSRLQATDASGEGASTPVGSRLLDRSMLLADGTFLLDLGEEVYVWVGRRVPAEERRKGLAIGMRWCTKEGRPAWTRVAKVDEGAEVTARARFDPCDFPRARLRPLH